MSALGAVVGLAFDQALGEPPLRWHPVARFGQVMGRVERTLYHDERRAGVAHLGIGLAVSIVPGLVLRRLFGRTAATAVATAVCAAGRMLDDEAAGVAALCEAGALGPAREQVRSLVGRCADDLDSNELSRAIVESVAENSVDAVTSSLFWGAVGGAPLVLTHRAVNTLDAMVGHRNTRYRRFGWASARLDDVLNFVPARLTALAVAVASPARARAVGRAVLRDAHQHPSPNGGVIEAAYAGALGITLGGANRYGGVVEDRGRYGGGPIPTPSDVHRAIQLRRRSTTLLALGVSLPALRRFTATRDRVGLPGRWPPAVRRFPRPARRRRRRHR